LGQPSTTTITVSYAPTVSFQLQLPLQRFFDPAPQPLSQPWPTSCSSVHCTTLWPPFPASPGLGLGHACKGRSCSSAQLPLVHDTAMIRPWYGGCAYRIDMEPHFIRSQLTDVGQFVCIFDCLRGYTGFIMSWLTVLHPFGYHSFCLCVNRDERHSGIGAQLRPSASMIGLAATHQMRPV